MQIPELPIPEEELRELRTHGRTGRPLGMATFHERLEAIGIRSRNWLRIGSIRYVSPNTCSGYRDCLEGREPRTSFSNAAGLAAEKVALMWEIAPPRMPIAGPTPTASPVRGT
jgi:hypothetical protein